MGENATPLETETEDIRPLTHTRILWLMGLIAILSAVLGIVFETISFGFGIIVGGLLSFLNYYWLKYSLKKVFDYALEGEKPRIFGSYYILRYLVIGLILVVLFLTDLVPIVAVILGLSSFAFAVVIEGILRIFSSFSNKREI